VCSSDLHRGPTDAEDDSHALIGNAVREGLG